MALYWDWKQKCGEAIFTDMRDGNKIKVELYEGNAFLIFIYIDEVDNTYSLYSFFADAEHAKNLLGLSKKQYKNCLGLTQTNIFDGAIKLTDITIYSNKFTRKNYIKLVELLCKAFSTINISIIQRD